MDHALYPASSADIARKRRELAPAQLEAFRAFSAACFADGALPGRIKQLIAVAVAHTSGSQQSASLRHDPHVPPTQAWLARHDPQRRHAAGIGSSGHASPARRIDRS